MPLHHSFGNSRITVCVSTELLLTARTVDEALDLLKRTGFEGDCCLWEGEQLVAVHFAGGRVLRLWSKERTLDATRN